VFVKLNQRLNQRLDQIKSKSCHSERFCEESAFMHTMMRTKADPSSQKNAPQDDILKIITVIPNVFCEESAVCCTSPNAKIAFIFAAKKAKPPLGISSQGAAILRLTSCL
jgi:hypothetical protein